MGRGLYPRPKFSNCFFSANASLGGNLGYCSIIGIGISTFRCVSFSYGARRRKDEKFKSLKCESMLKAADIFPSCYRENNGERGIKRYKVGEIVKINKN